MLVTLNDSRINVSVKETVRFYSLSPGPISSVADRSAASPSFHGNIQFTYLVKLLTSSSRAEVDDKVLFRINVWKIVEEGMYESSRQVCWGHLLDKRKPSCPSSSKHVLTAVLDE
jgi:hypothetical protein